jgi:hypothetical protein
MIRAISLIAVMMETVQSSDTSVNSYGSTRRYNLQEIPYYVRYFISLGPRIFMIIFFKTLVIYFLYKPNSIFHGCGN